MHSDFWLDKWQRGETGFHQDEVNPYLARHQLRPEAQGKVFVPLCGKSLDLWWMRRQGHEVLGVELSELAVQAFFAEAGQQPAVTQNGRFVCHEAEGVALWCGNFFDLTPIDVAGCTAVYDRASLIALPPQMRESYARHLCGLFPDGRQVLLITLDYDQREMSGPPFAVTDAEVRELYANGLVELLESRDVLAENDRIRQRGISRLHENVYRIELCAN
jgi:thiopurine S-methyltransferase